MIIQTTSNKFGRCLLMPNNIQNSMATLQE